MKPQERISAVQTAYGPSEVPVVSFDRHAPVWRGYEEFLTAFGAYLGQILDPRYGFVPDTFKSSAALRDA
ncbi:hypothetical protein [Kitasatospora mediocidica]|uniref:hypothetical protein n=1 Tax=Kitasatospora mediocidica TaxID=58352 RepID=UPI0012F876FF|nr:hypothetical protein [Kitasatospora mediocidica]